jgi:hypothetical protein
LFVDFGGNGFELLAEEVEGFDDFSVDALLVLVFVAVD